MKILEKAVIVFLVALILLVLGSYLKLFLSIDARYLPVWSDEIFYFKNAQSFYIFTSLKAAFTATGKGAILFGSDPHGFVYPLFYGSIAKIAGWHNTIFIYTNVALLLLCVFVIAVYKRLSTGQKLMGSALLLLFPFALLFSVTFMQEMIHLLIALVAGILLYEIYTRKDNKRYIISFVILLVLASLLRNYWLFFLVGLLPLSKTKKEFIGYSSLFIAGVLLSFLLSTLVFEPAPNFFSCLLWNIGKHRYLKAGHIFLSKVEMDFVKFFINFYDKPFSALGYLTMHFLPFILVLFFLVKGRIRKDKYLCAVGLSGLMLYVLLFLFYSTTDWREIRTMSILFYFSIIPLLLKTSKYYHWGLLIFLAYIFVNSYSTAKSWVWERKNILAMTEVTAIENKYAGLAAVVKTKNAIINIHYVPTHFTNEFVFLPIKNTEGLPIRYIANYDIDSIETPYSYTMENASFKAVPADKIVLSNEYFTLIRNENSR